MRLCEDGPQCRHHGASPLTRGSSYSTSCLECPLEGIPRKPHIHWCWCHVGSQGPGLRHTRVHIMDPTTLACGRRGSPRSVCRPSSKSLGQ